MNEPIKKRTIIIDEGPDFLNRELPERKIVPIKISSRIGYRGFR